LFFAGAIAICAMILPGISGSFILVILGAYKTLSDAIHDIDVKKITLFVGGAVIGLLSFSRVLKWLFKHYHNTTLALLTGFIIGSLNKVWPWKKTISVLNETTGEVQLLSEITNIGSLSIFQQQTNDFQTYKTVLEESILPFHYSELNNYLVKDYLLTALALMLVGFLTIFILEKIGSKKS
jgi:putative membrane protein